jgi:polar amino acid transport system ATP-binding protein
MISIDGLWFEYTPGVPALKNITASFAHDSGISAILGESGSGKTTLLRCLGRFAAPTKGTISIDSTAIGAIDEKAFRRRLGLVFQNLYLFPHMTVLRNLTLAPEKAHGIAHAKAEEKAMHVLRRLGVDDLRDSYPVQLSGGQAQRAAIARALVLDPEYLLLDEPTSALDINTTREFGRWLKSLRERTKFIIVTHDIEFTREVASDGILLENGEVKAAGDTAHIVDSLMQEVGE